MRHVCPACGCLAAAQRALSQETLTLMRCAACCSHFIEPTQSAIEPQSLESRYWEPYKFDLFHQAEVQREFEVKYDLMLQRIASIDSGPLRVLDVGCGLGNFLAFLKGRGIEGVGIELDEGARRATVDRGLTAHSPTYGLAALEDGSFDLLTMLDVIEHVYDPKQFLEGWLKKLRSGGLLYLETPNDSFALRKVLLAGAALMPRLDVTDTMYYWEHKVYFTRAGAEALIASAGGHIISLQTGVSPREKMKYYFRHDVEVKRRAWDRALARLWPLVRFLFSAPGLGNTFELLAEKKVNTPDDWSLNAILVKDVDRSP